MCQFTERATELSRRRGELEQQADEVATFLARYSLSAREVEALQRAPLDNLPALPDESGGDGGEPEAPGLTNAGRFFAALRRLRQVKRGPPPAVRLGREARARRGKW